MMPSSLNAIAHFIIKQLENPDSICTGDGLMITEFSAVFKTTLPPILLK